MLLKECTDLIYRNCVNCSPSKQNIQNTLFFKVEELDTSDDGSKIFQFQSSPIDFSVVKDAISVKETNGKRLIYIPYINDTLIVCQSVLIRYHFMLLTEYCKV